MTDFIADELQDLQVCCERVINGSKVIACVPQVVQVKITRTEYKQLTAHFQFPADYPNCPIIIELKSKMLDYSMMQGLENVCNEEAKQHLGKRQIIPMLLLIRKFIDDNPLCVCRDEVLYIQQNLLESGDSLKLKQKSAQIHLKVHGGRYFMKISFAVPELYPKERLGLKCTEHNLPEVLLKNFVGSCAEMSRQAVTPPIRRNPKVNKPFEPSPCLRKIAVFIIRDGVKRYHNELCYACKTPTLPPEPKDVVTDPHNPKFVVRIYCGHIYHYKCMDDYMKIPPFTGGKKCLGPDCGKRIYHDKWNITPEIAEARWAHQEARNRELDDVIDFLK